jgi:hypothetical protein
MKPVNLLPEVPEMRSSGRTLSEELDESNPFFDENNPFKEESENLDQYDKSGKNPFV